MQRQAANKEIRLHVTIVEVCVRVIASQRWRVESVSTLTEPTSCREE